MNIGGKEIALGGDIILSIDGIQIKSADDLGKIRDRIAGLARGTPLKATVMREAVVALELLTAVISACKQRLNGTD